jgi:hypothetical protein
LNFIAKALYFIENILLCFLDILLFDPYHRATIFKILLPLLDIGRI